MTTCSLTMRDFSLAIEALLTMRGCLLMIGAFWISIGGCSCDKESNLIPNYDTNQIDLIVLFLNGKTKPKFKIIFY